MTGILVFVLAFILLVVVIQHLAKAGVRGIEKIESKIIAKDSIKDNVYIKGHVQMLKENKQYDEYLKWMDENNVPGVPFERVKSTEETKADNEIQKLFNKSR